MINKLLNRKGKTSNSTKLKDSNGNIISTSLDVAEKFNDYFSSIASNLKEQMAPRTTFDPGGFLNYLNNSCSNSMYIKPVAASEIYQVINKFQIKSTLDTKIGPLKIANSSFKFTETLANVVNTSFNEGVFPRSLKNARVIPIYKEGSKTEVSNYRPISLLSAFSKIYEKLMHSRVLEFLDSNNALFENQYGFRPGRSCEHALLNAKNTILHSLNKREIAMLLCIDYSKAFDVLEHSILLRKLNHYGIRGIVLEWFKSYLSDRKQFVTINNIDSTARDISYGVPQGSILGPLLFVIYINDLPGISTVAKFILYADDANIIVTGINMHEVLQKMENVIHDLVNWVSCNGLILNLKKTNYMIFTRQRIENSSIEININGTKIERKTEMRFLGVIIDERLTWSHHIAAVRLKMARYVGIMYKIKNQIPMQARVQIYHSFVQSHLNYCSLVWGFAAKSLIESLFSKQKQGMRAIIPGFINYRYNDGTLPTHTKKYFDEYGILTVHGIIIKNALTLMHRMKYFPQTVPLSIRLTIPENVPNSSSTHSNSTEWLSIYNTINFRPSVFNKGPLLFISELNINATTLPSLLSHNIYKKSVKRMLLILQNQGPPDEWPNFLLFNIPGLRRSARVANQLNA